MKNLFKTTLTLLFSIGILFSFESCLKEDEPTETELLTPEDDPTKIELLTTEGGWTLTSTATNSDEIADALIALTFQLVPIELQTPEYEEELRADFTLTPEEEECEKDDIVFFKADGSALQDQGTLKCFPDSPQSEPDGTWSCSEDEKQLILTDSFGTMITLEVIDISSTTLTIRQSTPLVEEGIDLNFESIEHLEGWENLEGYDDFLETELVLTFTLTAN